MKFIKEPWFKKGFLTIVASQIGIIIIIFLVGPSKDISFWDSISTYLLKGSLFLSSVSIAANLIAIYFFGERGENKYLMFEINKTGLVWLKIIICVAGISYAILPNSFNPYFLIIQFAVFIILIYWIFKINHIVQNKDSYSSEVDKKGMKTMESAKKLKKHEGISFE